MKRRSDSNSVSEQVKQHSTAVADPPDHVYLRERDLPFWRSIMQARAAGSWTDSDLELAAVLARAKADVVRLQDCIDAEGNVIDNGSGPVVHPLHRLVKNLEGRAMSLSRLLHVHATATRGRKRDPWPAGDNP